MTHANEWSPETLAVHAGLGQHEYRPLIPPIYQTSAFAFADVAEGAALFAGRGRGYIYSRMGNPTVAALETALAVLEDGTHGLACASGMAAVHTALASLVKQGDHVVCSDVVYGPSDTLLRNILAESGIQATFVDTSDLAAFEQALRPTTRVVFVETPANPTLVVSDLAAIAARTHRLGARVIVDNTFMSPILQQPLRLGADIVVHSLTKFLNGHADVVGGAIIVRDDELYTLLRRRLNHYGGVLAPFEAFLVHRGLKTLALRMARQCENAARIAAFLEGHPKVAWVRYPGLRSHPQYELARRQMRSAGAMICFGLVGGLEAGRAMMNAVRLCLLAVSLGGVETLIQHPASMTHASIGAEARQQAHIDDGLVRLAVGIENVDDLIRDLAQALEK